MTIVLNKDQNRAESPETLSHAIFKLLNFKHPLHLPSPHKALSLFLYTLKTLKGDDTLTGRQLLSKFYLPSEKWSTLKGKNLLPFLFRVDPFPEGTWYVKMQNRKSQKLSSLDKMAENLPCVSSSLN